MFTYQIWVTILVYCELTWIKCSLCSIDSFRKYFPDVPAADFKNKPENLHQTTLKHWFPGVTWSGFGLLYDEQYRQKRTQLWLNDVYWDCRQEEEPLHTANTRLSPTLNHLCSQDDVHLMSLMDFRFPFGSTPHLQRNIRGTIGALRPYWLPKDRLILGQNTFHHLFCCTT